MKKIIFLLACMVLFLSACMNKDDTEKIKIASAATSESAIIANIIKLMIEHYTDEDIVMINNLGTSVTLHQAMMNGDANVSSVRYTGTDLIGALGKEAVTNSEEAMEIVQTSFTKEFDQTFFDSYGFENTYAFMVTQETAKKYNLKTVSDLTKIASKMEVGIDNSWLNRKGDGYEDFKRVYGYEFKKVYPMQIGLVYDALAAGKMDMVLGYTTDGRIGSYDLVLLEDDLEFFPPYDASAVVTNELLEAKPALKPLFEKLVGQIPTEKMQELNFEVDNNLVEPAIVAERFLEENNYFEEEDGK